MRSQLAAVVTVLCAAATAATAQNRSLESFDALRVDTAMTVVLACGDRPSASVEADPPILAEDYLDLQVVAQPHGERLAELHFRRDFDRHVHPDRMRLLLTVDRPLRHVTATTGARVTLPPCALDGERLTLQVESDARIELSGETRRLELTVESGGAVNALSGGRDLRPKQVEISAGHGTRVALCGAESVVILRRAASAMLRTDC